MRPCYQHLVGSPTRRYVSCTLYSRLLPVYWMMDANNDISSRSDAVNCHTSSWQRMDHPFSLETSCSCLKHNNSSRFILPGNRREQSSLQYRELFSAIPLFLTSICPNILTLLWLFFSLSQVYVEAAAVEKPLCVFHHSYVDAALFSIPSQHLWRLQ